MSVDYRPDYDPADVDHDYGHTGGDITVPTFQGNTKPFKFWCQKALPLVYDDSLSYYEVLCKMADYLNGFMTDLKTVEDSMTEFGEQFVINQQFLNTMADQLGQNVADLEAYINDRMDDFMAAYTQLQTYVNNYFDNLDVQEEINSKLDEMASDGTLNDLFDPVLETWMQQKTAQIDAAISNQNAVQAEQNGRISVLEGRMDTFSSLPSGSTSGNAELLDIRTNFLGETYPSAGDAVRASDMIASGFQSIPATLISEWDGNDVSSVYDTIQINISGYKGGHIAVIGSFDNFIEDLTTLGTCSVYATNVSGANADTDAVNYAPGSNSIFKTYTQITTSIQGEERLLMQFAIPDNYTYEYLKIGHVPHGILPAYHTDPLYIAYGNSWSKTPVDDTLSIAGDAADAKATGDAIDELNERLSNEIDKIAEVTVISEISPTPVTEPFVASFTEGYYIMANGTKVASESYHYTEKIPVEKGDVFSTPGVSIRFVTAYNGDTVVSASGESTTVSSYTVPDGIDGIILTLYSSATTINKTYYPVSFRNALDDVLEMSNITTFPSFNRFDEATITEGKMLASSGNGLTDNETYNTSDYIYIGDLDSIKIYRNQTPVLYNVYYVLFDANKNYLDSRTVGNNITVGSAEYIRFSYSNDQSYIQAVDGSKKVSWYSAYQTPTTERDSERFIELASKCSQLFTSNVLYGKKWVACGDSFTEGAYYNVTNPEDRYIMNGRYMGENAVYPFIIGNRNDMVIVNEAVSGSTMCLNDGTHNAFSTANGRYTQIPSDADYITLYFGINDVNYNSPMGEITDDNNTTFYGAWNVVMDYLIEHHPFAKIGIIVTNGASQAIREAEIAIAKRWGVAFYDMNGLPLMHRSFNQDVLTSVKNERNENFRVSADNLHPNKKAHEYQSTCIEAWLRTL